MRTQQRQFNTEAHWCENN